MPPPILPPDSVYISSVRARDFHNFTAFPGPANRPVFGLPNNAPVTTGDIVLWDLGVCFLVVLCGVTGMGLVRLVHFLHKRRKHDDSPPSDSLLKVWWMKLRNRKGASGDKEGRAIRMENLRCPE